MIAAPVKPGKVKPTSLPIASLVEEALSKEPLLDDQIAYVKSRIAWTLDLIEKAKAAYVQGLIYEARHRTIQSLKRNPNPAPPVTATHGRIASIKMQSIFDTWCLPLGAIGDYTATMLREFAADEKARAEGITRNVVFYSALAFEVEKSGKQTVRQGMKEDKFKELLEQSRK
jgi:hypothetical protein